MTSDDGRPSDSDPTLPGGPATPGGPGEPTQAMPSASPPGDDGGSGSKKWWWIVGGVVAVMIVVIVAALVLRDDGSDDSASETTSTSTSSTTTTSSSTTTSTTTTPPPAGPQIDSFQGPSSAGCPSGEDPPQQQVELTWSTTDATSVTIGIDNPGPFDTYSPSGSATLPYTCPGPHTYHLVATGPGGEATSVINIPGS